MPDIEGKKPEEMETSEKKTKKSRYGVISVFVLVVCSAVFLFAMYNIVKDYVETLRSDKTVGELQDVRLDYEEQLEGGLILPDATGKGEEGDLTPSPDTGSSEKDARVYRLVFDETGDDSLSFLQAPLDAMKERNPDTVGWFNFPDSSGTVSGLPIDLPIVYSGDNEYYLEHNFDGEKNMNGWVFVDFRNGVEYMSDNYNTILYGHARSNNMFGGLKYLNTKKKWYNDKQNHYLYIKTPNEETVWQIFAWYEASVAEETASEFNYIRTNFLTPAAFVQFCNILQDKNEINAFDKFVFDSDDRILTLSTCKSYDKDVRVVVHAKLVKLGVWEESGE